MILVRMYLTLLLAQQLTFYIFLLCTSSFGYVNSTVSVDNRISYHGYQRIVHVEKVGHKPSS